MKRTYAILLLLLFLCLPVTARANERALIIDDAELLTDQEEISLFEKSSSIQSDYLIDAVILTVDSLGGKSAQEHADDYYDRNGYQEDGVLFLLSMDEREWYISTSGSCIYALTDYGIQKLGEEAVWYLSNGSYYEAFDAYLSALPYYLDAYENGSPVDGMADYSGDYYHGEQEEILYYQDDTSPNLLLSLMIGVITALVTILIMRAGMNSKRKQHSAAGYMKENTYRLKQQQDLFLYSNISKVRKQEQTNSGGGSSVHRSSSGRSHGGGGGRF